MGEQRSNHEAPNGIAFALDLLVQPWKPSDMLSAALPAWRGCQGSTCNVRHAGILGGIVTVHFLDASNEMDLSSSFPNSGV